MDSLQRVLFHGLHWIGFEPRRIRWSLPPGPTRPSSRGALWEFASRLPAALGVSPQWHAEFMLLASLDPHPRVAFLPCLPERPSPPTPSLPASRRLDLGLLQREVAQQLGVAPGTATNWELSRTSPALRLLPRILAPWSALPPHRSAPRSVSASRPSGAGPVSRRTGRPSSLGSIQAPSAAGSATSQFRPARMRTWPRPSVALRR